MVHGAMLPTAKTNWPVNIQNGILYNKFIIFIYSELASKVMIELLGTYTDENASHAREDAIKCIVTALADPNTFLLDPLLSLTPVRSLEGELIHDLLTIFVSEQLSSYQKFYDSHKEFVQSQGNIILILSWICSNPQVMTNDETQEVIPS